MASKKKATKRSSRKKIDTSALKSRVKEASKDEQFSKMSKSARLKHIAEMIEDSGFDPAELGRVDKIAVSRTTTTKDGGVSTTDRQVERVVFSPTWANGPTWQPVGQAAPVKITTRANKLDRGKGLKTCLVLPDPQIGFRDIKDPKGDYLHPFHDEQAMMLAIEMIRHVKPDVIVNVGDLLDLAEFGRFQQEPSFARTTQPSIDVTHRWLAMQRAVAGPDCEVIVLEGNHDLRISTSIINNAKAAYGLRRADTPEEWPVLSVPYLLRLDELDIEYVEGYPAGVYYLNEICTLVHGETVRPRAKTAAAVLATRPGLTTIHGHIHRIEHAYGTFTGPGGVAVPVCAMTPGCLCHTDGRVPSGKTGVSSRDGLPIERVMDWQQGVAVVKYDPEGTEHFVEVCRIQQGKTLWGGKIISVEPSDELSV